jgi:hypothetical protein
LQHHWRCQGSLLLQAHAHTTSTQESRASGSSHRVHSVAQQPLEVARELLQLLAAMHRKGDAETTQPHAVKRLKIRDDCGLQTGNALRKACTHLNLNRKQ